MNTSTDLNFALMDAVSAEDLDLQLIEDLLQKGADPLAPCRNRNRWLTCALTEFLCRQEDKNNYENAPRVIRLFFDHGMPMPENTARSLDDVKEDPFYCLAQISNEAGLRMLKIFLDNSCSPEKAEIVVKYVFEGLAGNVTSFEESERWQTEASYQIKMLMLIATYPPILQQSLLLRELIQCDRNDVSNIPRFSEGASFDCLIKPVPDLESVCNTGAEVKLKSLTDGAQLWSMDLRWTKESFVSLYREEYSSPLLNLMTESHPDLSRIEEELRKGYSPREVSRAAKEYVDTIRWDGEDDEEDVFQLSTDHSKRSAYMYSVFELLLRYGLDPNAVFNDWSVMTDLIWFGNNYSGADTLRLLLEHGADPMLPIDREGDTVFEEVSFEVRFAAIELGRRWIYDAIVHSWFVLLAYQGNRESEFFFPVTICSDTHRYREEYDLEEFKIEDLKEHRNYSFGLTLPKEEHDPWVLHIFDKRSWWEVARWE
ncbi:MAG: hypothetical protein IJK38_00305 [Oscillospiraceae bacterium]|nr:hypothetical protein [Oscillospiraceae bacterium]